MNTNLTFRSGFRHFLKWAPAVLIGVFSVYSLYKSWTYFSAIGNLRQDGGHGYWMVSRILLSNYVGFAVAGVVGLTYVWNFASQEKRMLEQQHVLERLNWSVERIFQMEQVINGLRDSPPRPAEVWPWGTHTTAALEDLAAAAKRFWTNYDPADPSTAPTNEMVSDWIRSERKASKEKAAAIASILRADGLKAGPRR